VSIGGRQDRSSYLLRLKAEVRGAPPKRSGVQTVPLVVASVPVVSDAPEDVTDLPVHLTVVAGRVAHHRD